MSYQLGIDFGTTHLSAAVRRGDQQVEVVRLGGDSATVPAALHLARDGGVTVGEGALRLAGIDAGRVVRAVKRRLGDPAPIVVGGEPWSAEQLSARLVRWVVDRVAEQEGGPADHVVLAHPAAWRAAVLGRLGNALDGRGVRVTFLAEPEAVAAAHEAAGAVLGATVAVCDFGGGRCDAAVLRRVGGRSGFAVVGRPEGLADLGGLDLDELLIGHVRAGLSDDRSVDRPVDARTRRACVRAKETLSTRTEVVVRFRQGDVRGEVGVDRATFEDLIAPCVARTVAAMRRTIASADLGPGEPATVLLAGGSARIPSVPRMLTDALRRPVTLVDDPELVVARGAALAVPGPAGRPVPDGPETVELVVPGRVRAAAAARVSAPALPGRIAARSGRTAAGSVAVAPVAEESVAVAPVLVAPVVEKPVAAAPAAVAPAVVERVASGPVVDEPVAAAVAAPAVEDSVLVEPVAGAPAVVERVVADPVAEELVTGAPVGVAPTVEEPVAVSPVVEEPVAVAPVVSAPVVEEAVAAGPVAVAPAAVDPLAGERSAGQPSADEVAPPAMPVRYSASPRPAAVLDGCRRGARRRSLPRLLLGAGALVVAALVVVALFRPDGPLDPPTDPVARDGADPQTAAPAVPGPAVAVPLPAGPMPAVEGVRAEPPPAPVRPTAPVRGRTLTDNAPGGGPDDAARASVVTTPPAPPAAPGSAKASVSGRPVARPVGAAPRVPPTPAAPSV